jgi:hypothetical protein
MHPLDKNSTPQIILILILDLVSGFLDVFGADCRFPFCAAPFNEADAFIGHPYRPISVGRLVRHRLKGDERGRVSDPTAPALDHPREHRMRQAD